VTFWAWLATVGAAVMIGPLVEKKTYLWHGAVGAAVLGAVGAALRARRVPWPVILLVQAAALAEWCVLAYARSEAWLGIVPTQRAFAELADHVTDFIGLSQRYAAPIPGGQDVTVTLALFMIGLALLVDAVAVTWRKVPLLGLVFLAIYMAPVTLLGGEVSLFVFLPGAAGFVFLLAADERERLTHWGRQISAAGSVWDDPAGQVSRSGIATSGRRIGLSAVAAAVVLPVALPTLSPHYFGQSGSGGGGGGSGSDGLTSVRNPVLDLKKNLSGQSDAVLVEFSTDQPDPGYLRLASLNVFEGSEWSPGDREESAGVPSHTQLPAVPGLRSTVPRTGYHYDVQITDALDSSWLPLLYAPTRIEADQTWTVNETSLDATAVESGQSTAGTSYGFDAVVVEPSAADLREAPRPPAAFDPYTDLPEDLPPIIAQQAREATAGAETAFDQALALQSWFRTRGGFRYSLETDSGTGMETIEEFLAVNRVGYCEQFASAMALMARTLKIPSRVAVGFLRPEFLGAGDYAYRGIDMHTWPELYFDGIGWVRFEPTPAVQTGSAPEFGRDNTANIGRPGDTPTTEQQRPTDSPTPSDATADAAAASGSNGSGPWSAAAAALGVVALALLSAVAPRLLRQARSRSRWRAATGPVASAEAAWAELRDNVLDLRMDWDARLTPRGMGRALRARLDPDETFVRQLNRIVLACEQGRYARTVRDPNELREAVATVTAALAATRSKRVRWFARWLPASLVTGRPSRAAGAGRPRRTGDALVTVAE